MTFSFMGNDSHPSRAAVAAGRQYRTHTKLLLDTI